MLTNWGGLELAFQVGDLGEFPAYEVEFFDENGLGGGDGAEFFFEFIEG